MRRQSTFQEDPGEIVKRVRAWVEEVTGRELSGDFRERLQDGIVLCELMAKLMPGSIQRVNKLKSPIAHLDNIRSFLQSCRVHFQLNEAQIFDVTDLQDPEQRSGAFTSVGKKGWDAEKRLKNVCVTLYWLGRVLAEDRKYQGPLPDLSVFHPVLPGQTMSVPIPEEPEEGSSNASAFKSPVPPSVPSRPDPKLLKQATVREGAEKVQAGQEMDTKELLIVPVNGSFGFHLLSKPLEGTNKFVSTVHSVLEDSAADRGGLRRGDQLEKVNGMDTAYFSHQQIVKLVKDSASTGTLAVRIRRKQPGVTNSEVREERRHSPPTRHFNSHTPPPAPRRTVEEVSVSVDSSPDKSAPHYVVDTGEADTPKYRPVPPPPDEAIYVNQPVVQREDPGKEAPRPGKPRKSSPTKESPPRAQRGTLERESRNKKVSEGGTEVKEQTLGAKIPRSQIPLPEPPIRAPNSEPTRRKFHSSEESGSLKRGAGKSCKVAVVESVDVSSPPAKLETLSMEMSEDSGEDVLQRRSAREQFAANRVSISDPFRGILPVSDGRSLLDEIFPEGEESSLSSILPEESPLKSPPQQSRQQPTREYFSKILHPQISQQESHPPPPPGPEAKLREERVRQSPAASTGSSERHSAKLVGSLLSGAPSYISPADQDSKKTAEKKETKFQNADKNSNPPHPEPSHPQPIHSSHPQAPSSHPQPVPSSHPQPVPSSHPQAPSSHPQPPSSTTRRPYAHVTPATDNIMSTHSLPQSYQPPTHTSINSSPTRHSIISHQAGNQVAGKRGVKGHISRAKSFTGAHHPSRDSSDERNFSSLMSGAGGGAGVGGQRVQRGEFLQSVHGVPPPQGTVLYPQEGGWGQRGIIQRGQSMRQDPRLPEGRYMLQRQAQSETGVPPYNAYPTSQLIRGAYPFHPPQSRFQTPQTPQYPQQVPQTPQYPQQIPQSPPDGLHKSKIFQINPNNASIPCSSCGHPLGVGVAAGVHGKKNIYHPGCFRCEVCGGQLLESSYILKGKLHCVCCKDSDEGTLNTVC